VSAGIFVQANNNQLVAAKVAKFALETTGGAKARGLPVTIINVDESPLFEQLRGLSFRCGSGTMRYDRGRVQSFTLARFMPPELMTFEGRAIVIDPDVLALSDIGELLSLELKGNAIAACRRDMGWETSVMLLDCEKLSHWKIESFIARLKDQSLDYLDLLWLREERHVLGLPDIWNSHDKIVPDTKMLHMTRVDTQPWKTGLAVGATLHETPLLGIIPRALARRMLGKPERRFKPHPEITVENAFLAAFKGALASGAVSRTEVSNAVSKQLIRADIWEHVA
jgi:hypothetical protein